MADERQAAANKLASNPESLRRDRNELAMLQGELAHMRLAPDDGKKIAGATSLLELRQIVGGLKEPLAALCLSGGGIRSASFALGILQGLAKYKLLPKFHYLSTVSGGGYIGAWLSALRLNVGNDHLVVESLGGRSEDAVLGKEIPQLEHLRKYSNFLTPRLGVFSGDTWSIASLYIRNLLLNWVIFLPLLAACVTLPILVTNLHVWIESLSPGDLNIFENRLAWIAVGIAAFFLVLGLSLTLAESAAEEGTRLLTQNQVLGRILIPIYASGIAVVVVAILASPAWQLAASAGIAIYFVSAAVAVLRRRNWKIARRFISWMAAGATFGALISVGITLWDTGEHGVYLHVPGAVRVLIGAETLLTTFGISWFVLAVVAAETVYVGLASYAKNADAEREWLARSSGILFVVAIGWTALSLVALVGPEIIRSLQTPVAAGALGVGAAAGVGSALAGRASMTKALPAARETASKLPKGWILPLLAALFLIALGVALAMGVGSIIAQVGGSPLDQVAASLAVVVAGVVIAAAASTFININRFSPHALYRNRLIRAFLGGARSTQRTPDPFTGFDQKDNVKMADLAPISTVSQFSNGLFHVVNVALNVVNTSNLAWQQRKAETFTITPLHCGNPNVGFKPSAEYGGKISLGTAVTISGAAASPNMGYHSSPLISAIMMLFNVRLGWWLGNPRTQGESWKDNGPRSSFLLMIKEMLGLTSSEDEYIYLSDGGHFENLALYEMIRRRCKFIVVSDAACDPKCTLEDLGNAVRKIKIDFGVDVTFAKITARARAVPADPLGRFCAVADIHYPEDGGHPEAAGKLIYFKPGLYGELSPAISAYGNLSSDFPHETTGDQWFSEAQLESYRALGCHAIDCLFPPGRVPNSVGPRDFLTLAEQHAK